MGLGISNLVQTWSTKTRITDKRGDLQGQRLRSRGHVMRLTGVGRSSRMKRPRNTKLSRKIAHLTGNNAHQVWGQNVRGQGHQAYCCWERKCAIPAKLESLLTSNWVCSWSMNSRITGELHDLQRQSSRWRGYVVPLTVAAWVEKERSRKTKISKRILHATGNKAHQFQGEKVKVTRPIIAEIICHIFRTGRPTNFKLGTRMKHEDP